MASLPLRYVESPRGINISSPCDVTWPLQETVFFVRDTVKFAGFTAEDFLVGNITQGDPLPGDGYVQWPSFPQAERLHGLYHVPRVAGFSPPASDFSGGDPTFSSGQGLIETLCENGDGECRDPGRTCGPR